MTNPNIASRFDEIYDSTSTAVLAYITVKCKNTADISDILQETYMELYQVLIKRGAEYIKNDKAFVMRIAKHKIARHYSLLERLKLFIPLSSDDEEHDDVSGIDIDALSLEDKVINQILLNDARKYIQSKSEIVKKVFYLYYDIGMTIPEIAKALSISESNVKHKLYRTLQELKNLLTNW